MALSQPRGQVSSVVQKLAESGKPSSKQGGGRGMTGGEGASHAGSMGGSHITGPLSKLVRQGLSFQSLEDCCTDLFERGNPWRESSSARPGYSRKKEGGGCNDGKADKGS